MRSIKVSHDYHPNSLNEMKPEYLDLFNHVMKSINYSLKSENRRQKSIVELNSHFQDTEEKARDERDLFLQHIHPDYGQAATYNSLLLENGLTWNKVRRMPENAGLDLEEAKIAFCCAAELKSESLRQYFSRYLTTWKKVMAGAPIRCVKGKENTVDEFLVECGFYSDSQEQNKSIEIASRPATKLKDTPEMQDLFKKGLDPKSAAILSEFSAYFEACRGDPILIEFCTDILARNTYQFSTANILHEGALPKNELNAALARFTKVFKRKDLAPLFMFGCRISSSGLIEDKFFEDLSLRGINMSKNFPLFLSSMPQYPSDRLARVYFDELYRKKVGPTNFMLACMHPGFARYCAQIDEIRSIEIMENWKLKKSNSILDGVLSALECADYISAYIISLPILNLVERWLKIEKVRRLIKGHEPAQKLVVKIRSRFQSSI